MIITKTPFRISFVGGGSDLECFYSKYPGAVLSTSINKHMYISTHHFFEPGKFRIKYFRTEDVSCVDQIKHPLVRAILKKFPTASQLEINSTADVPAGTGLGSSSAFTVGLLNNIHTLLNHTITKKQLAEEACDIEIKDVGEPIGKQDQYIAAFGGMNIFQFHSDGTVTIDPIKIKPDILKRLESNLLMFYTGEQRQTSSILTEMKNNLTSADDKSMILKKMVELVWETKEILSAGDLTAFGDMLNKNWILKQKLAKQISNENITEVYKTALENGATGGKLLGAGGGGFLLFYCEPQKQEKLRSTLSNLTEMKFLFEKEGSKIIYVQEENADYTYLNRVTDAICTTDKNMLNKAIEYILETYNNDGIIYVFGNGGSGATASHFAGDLNKGVSYGLNRRFRVICLNDNIPGMTAISNDLSYEDIFVESLKNFLRKEDLVISFTGSGNSKNIIKAIEYTRSKGIKTISFCGYDGGIVKSIVDVPIHSNINDMEISEDYQLIISHNIKRILSNRLHSQSITKSDVLNHLKIIPDITSIKENK